MKKKKEKKWSELSYEERRALLPEKLNKVGEWFLVNSEPLGVIHDMRAVLK